MVASQIARGGRIAVRPALLFRKFSVFVAGFLTMAGFVLSVPAARADALADLVETCAACHGPGGGAPTAPEIPVLAGQPELFLLYQLVYFRQGQRKVDGMSQAVTPLGDDALRGLAAYFAGQAPAAADRGAPDRARFERGGKLAKALRCGTCHAADFSGRDQMPGLAGQQEAYLLKALRDYKSGARVGAQAAMSQVVADLDEDGLRDLAHYFYHLGF
jgi:cytochrome c553